MDFNEYQEKARSTAIYIENGYSKAVYYPALGLAGETGEVCEKLKKLLRDDDFDNMAFLSLNDIPKTWKDKQEELKKELGDVLWYIANLAADLGLNMQDIAEANIDKLLDRKARGVLKGSGDNR
jgi:NTP pyrophosphatase (non-canonical NTP hydrolase)